MLRTTDAAKYHAFVSYRHGNNLQWTQKQTMHTTVQVSVVSNDAKG